MSTPIITSFLDTDLYKFTMMQYAFHRFPNATARYRFACRKKVDLRPLQAEIIAQLGHLKDLTWTPDELDYLANLPYMQPDFIDFLSTYRFNPAYVSVDARGDSLAITIEGPWLHTILFEIPLLAIISELYYQYAYPALDLTDAHQKLKQKIALITASDAETFRFSDFGTRRRYAKKWHHHIVKTLSMQLPKHFQGTSNVWCAKAYGLPPIGTMAHEYLQAAQVLAPDFLSSQPFAFKTWAEEYPGQLGIALTDVITMDIFLRDFDRTLADQYQGLRQDSGDPYQWAEKAIAHYLELGIDPKTKCLVFSNGLTFSDALALYASFKERAQVFFGIGTQLTNDVGLPSLDIVIKMTHANEQPVVKISDSPGKTMCESEQLLNYVKQVYNL